MNKDNVNWVSIREAASETGYTTEYIRQLARLEKISARRSFKAWYVDLDNLKQYKQDHEREAAK